MALLMVAVDGHPHSKKIVEHAIAVAKAMSAKILLTFVVTVPIPQGYRGDDYDEDEFERDVGPLADSVNKAGVQCEKVWLEGDPKKVIVSSADSHKVDMVVIGIHPLHNIGKLKAVGDISRAIIENSKVPVLVIP